MMDSANAERVVNRFTIIEETLQRHDTLLTSVATEFRHTAIQQEEAFKAMANQVQALTGRLSGLVSSVEGPGTAPAASPAPEPQPRTSYPPVEPQVGSPERYAGEPEGCRPFLTNCSILFSLQPHTFSSEVAKVAYVINHLAGRARLWGTAEWEGKTAACSSFQAFSTELMKVFDLESGEAEAARLLFQLRQGSRSVADYSIDFRTLASRSGFNAPALLQAFLQGLADYMKDELASRELPSGLDDVIRCAVRVDQRIRARRRERSSGRPSPRTQFDTFQLQPAAGPGALRALEVDEPMQIGHARLPEEGRRHQGSRSICGHCGGPNRRSPSGQVKGQTQ